SILDRHVCVINQRRGKDEQKKIKAANVLLSRQEGNGETTWCEHYGVRSSNQVALDVAGEEVVDPRGAEMVMNVSNRMLCYMLRVL
nr:hypothetical protein [Tanacetum cinerariifolium]